MYSDISQAYKASPVSHLGLSGHLSLALIHAYKSLSCRQRPSNKTVKVRTELASVYAEETDLEGHTSTDLSDSIKAFVWR